MLAVRLGEKTAARGPRDLIRRTGPRGGVHRRCWTRLDAAGLVAREAEAGPFSLCPLGEDQAINPRLTAAEPQPPGR